jgi:amino acid adenylation domain-containing protein
MSHKSPSRATIADIILGHASTKPDALAFLHLDEAPNLPEALTFGDLDTASRAIAEALRATLSEGDRVLLLFPPGLAFIEALIACLRSGIVGVPASLPRRGRSADRLATIIYDAGASAVLSHSSVIDRTLAALPDGITPAADRWLAADRLRLSKHPQVEEPSLDSNSLALIQYSSGSTGAPKGVMISHANLLDNSRMTERAFGHSAATAFLSWLPHFHDMGLIGTILHPICLGARVVLMSPGAFLRHPARWLRGISEYRATTSGAPNFAYDYCVDRISDAEMDGVDLSCWTVAFNGAEPVRAATIDRFSERFACWGFRRSSFLPCYGLAEATLFVSGGKQQTEPRIVAFDADRLVMGRAVPVPEPLPRHQRVTRLVGCGTAGAGVKVAIVDGERLCVSPGHIGEIWIQGASVGLGYWGKQQLTRETFGARSHGGGELGPFLRTGDLGFLDGSGELFVTGRRDDVLILHGRNYNAHEIEDAALASDTLLGPAAVAFQREDGGIVLLLETHTAVCEPERAEQIIEAVRRAVWVACDLAVDEIVLLRFGALPRTTSGKVQRHIAHAGHARKTRAQISVSASSDAPAPSAHGSRADLAPLIARRLRDILRMPQSVALPLDRSPIALGIDSLGAGELSARLSAELGIDCPIEAILGAETIVALAENCRAAVREGPSVIPPNGFSLTSLQQAIWVHQLAEPRSTVYNLSLPLRLRGSLDVERFRRVTAALIARHRVLRAIFATSSDGNGVGRYAGTDNRLSVIDASTWSDDDLRAAAAAAAARPIDLAIGPVFRAELFRRAEDDHLLVLIAHHIVMDIWSVAILLRDLALFYESGPDPRKLPPSSSPSPPRGGAGGALQPVPTPLLLPGRRPAEGAVAGPGRRRRFALPGDLADALRVRARGWDATPANVLLATYALFLQRHTGEDAVVIGVPVSERADLASLESVGCFLATKPVRIEVRAGWRLSALVQRVKHAMMQSFGQTGPAASERVISTLFALQRLPPLPGAITLVLGTEREQIDLGPWRACTLPIDDCETLFDLSLMLAESAGGLVGWWEYRIDRIDETVVEAMVARFEQLLHSVVLGPDVPTDSLSLLPDGERRALLTYSTGDRLPLPEGTLGGVIDAQAARTPDRVAVQMADTTLTYRMLCRQADAIARRLLREGVGREATVAVLIEASPAAIVAALGIWKAGATYLPVDPHYPVARIELILRQSGALVAIVDEPRAIGSGCSCQITFAACLAGGAEDERALPLVHNTQLAWVVFTSGSTGEPKGVMATHLAALNFAAAQRAKLGKSTCCRALSVASMSFDASLSDVLMSLPWGGTLVIAPGPARVPGPELDRLLETARISLLTAPSSLFAALAPRHYPDLAAIISTAEACSPELVARWSKYCRVFNGYGPSEATIGSSLHLAGVGQDGSDRVPVGRPLANYRVYVLDGGLMPVPVGVAGEIFVGGAGVARGYLDRPRLTAECFLPDPFASQPGERMFRTGDIGRLLPDGTLDCLGRLDAQVKIRGFRVEPAEIEAVIRRILPGTDCAVSAYAGANGDRRLAAFVAGSAGDPIIPASLLDALRQQLPPFMVPASVVPLTELPRNANGKLDRQALPDPCRYEEDGHPIVPPQNLLEAKILAIWRQILGRTQIGIEDNFFDAGGHSLLLPRLLGAIEPLGSHPISITDLFSHPTVRSLAGFIAAPQAAQAAPSCAQPSGHREAIAIVGMSLRFPDATDADAFWHNLAAGVESIRRFSSAELLAGGVDAALVARSDYVPARAIIQDIEFFDADFFGYTAREAEILDPQHRLLLECAQGAFDDAGYRPDALAARGIDTGVFVGCSSSSYFSNNIATHPDLVATLGPLKIGIGASASFPAMLIGYKLGLTGPCINVDTACSTALVAVHQACRSLAAGECDFALAGAAHIDVPIVGGHVFEVGGIGSPDEHCRTFDATAKGTVGGVGGAVLMLRRLADALRDGDDIRAVIRGSAVNNDGMRKLGFTAPSIEGQRKVIAQALANAGIEPVGVGYVEAHGTGTELGDVVEVEALAAAFSSAPPGSIGLGSVKTNIGHLGPAAGVAGLIKATLALAHAQLPPSLNYRVPNPRLNLAATPFVINTALASWDAAPLRRAGVSSFGIGGTNVHVILEEAPAQDPAMMAGRDGETSSLILLSARSAASLAQMRQRLADHVRSHPEVSLSAIAYTLQCGRREFSRRFACVVKDRAELISAMTDEASHTGQVEAAEPPRVAFMFPGQGAQHLAMAAELYRHEPCFRAAFDDCVERLRPLLGLDLRDLIYPPPSDAPSADARLRRTDLAQPALFSIEYALALYLETWGIRPDVLVGHSVGEYVAACLAGIFSLDDALWLVSERGRLMQSCAPGAMTAVAGASERVAALLIHSCCIAAVNGPDDTVIAGPVSAMSVQERSLTAAGLTFVRLPVARAFHSPLMDPILLEYERAVTGVALQPPRRPLVSTLTGDFIGEYVTDPEYWVRQLRQPVQFAPAIARLAAAEPGAIFVEVGPGRALSRFARGHPDTAGRLVLATLGERGSVEDDQRRLLATIGRLWVAGRPLNCENAHHAAGRQPRRVTLPGYAFDRRRYWIDPAPPAAPIEAAAPRPAPAIVDPAPEREARQLPKEAKDLWQGVIEEVWQQLFAVLPGPHDDFFASGGDSLLVARLCARLGRAAGISIDPRLIYENPTPSSLSKALGPVGQLPRTLRTIVPCSPSPPRGLQPLSYQQQGIWLLHKLEGESGVHNLPLLLTIRGRLDVAALRFAFAELQRCHPTLSLRIVERDGIPLQEFGGAEGEFELAVREVTADEALAVAESDGNKPFALAAGPLLRALLLRVETTYHLLVITLHHLAADGRSLLLLLRDLVACYDAQVAGANPPRQASSLHYADYVCWQHASAGDARVAEQLSYWHRELAGLSPFRLPRQWEQVTSNDDQRGSISFRIGPATVAAVTQRAQEVGVTPFVVLLTALKILLFRITGIEDVAVGTPMENRPHPELEDVVGVFSNMVVLRSHISGDLEVGALMRRLATRVVEAQQNLDVPFQQVIEALDPERSARSEPVVPLALVMQSRVPDGIALAGTDSVELTTLSRRSAKFDLSIWVDDRGEALDVRFEFRTGLFQRATVEHLARSYAVVVAEIAASARQPVNAIPLLDEAARELVLGTWSCGETPGLDDRPVHEMICAAVAGWADAVAVIADGGTTLSYRQLERRSNQLANYLRSQEIGIETPVGIALERSTDLVVALLATLKAGGAVVPLDPALPAVRIHRMAETVGLAAVVTTQELAERLAPGIPRIILLDRDATSIAAAGDSAVAVAVPPDALAYVVFTSGSTGRPKAVGNTHRGLRNRIDWMARTFSLTAKDRVLHKTPFGFDVALWELLSPLVSGGTLVLARPEGEKDPAYIGELLDRAAITVAHFVPSLLDVFLECASGAGRAALRLVACSGEGLPTSLAERFHREYGDSVELANLYGPAEASIEVSWQSCQPPPTTPVVPIGRPISHARLYVLDRELELLPPGSIGEICIGGIPVARGYLGSPGLTAERFVPDPYAEQPGARLYRTGDLGRHLPDGSVEFLGRSDRQVKLRGQRVELDEVQATLVATGLVQRAAVALRGVRADEMRLIAWVVPSRTTTSPILGCSSLGRRSEPTGDIAASGQDDPARLKAALREALARRLPEVMIPSEIVLVDALPVSTNGKLDFAALPESDRVASSPRPEGPVPGDTESRLTEIFAELLGRKAVARDDNFFAIGGNSLLAARLAARIGQAFGCRIPLPMLFDHPTIGGLAPALDGLPAAPSQLPELVADPEHRFAPFQLTEMQYAYWVGRFELGNISTYGYLEVDVTALDIERFITAVNLLIDRHDMLRCVVSGDKEQQILPQVPPLVPAVLDLADQREERASARLAAIRAEMSRPVAPDLSRWPSFQIRLSRLRDESWRIHLGLDAFAVDWVSLRLLEEDLNAIYQALGRGAAAPGLAAAPRISFRDYAIAAERVRHSEFYAISRRYWLERLTDLPPAPRLPQRADRNERTEPVFRRRKARLDRHLWMAIKHQAQVRNLTPAITLLAAYAETLATWCNSRHFLLSLPIADRLPLHPDVDRLVGNFTSLILLEVDLREAHQMATAAGLLQQRLSRDLEHRYFNGTEVRRALIRAHGGSHAVSDQVVFTSLLACDALATAPGPRMLSIDDEVFGVARTSQACLDCVAVERADGLALFWDAIDDLFLPGTLDHMFAAFVDRLHRLTEDAAWSEPVWSGVPAAQLERRRALAVTARRSSKSRLHDPFRQAAMRYPDRVALDAPSEKLTYAQLDRRCRALAWHLIELGAQPNRPVAILMKRGPEQVVAAVAASMAGAPYLAIDDSWPPRRRDELLRQCETTLMLTQTQFDGDVLPDGVRIIHVDKRWSEAPVAAFNCPAGADDLAYVIFTSGSTGPPKGAMIDHGAALNTISSVNRLIRLGPHDAVLALSALTFDLSVYDIFGPLSVGGRIVVPEASQASDPAHWLKRVAESGVTLWNSVPILASLLAEQAAAVGGLPPALRIALLSGDWIPLDLPARLRALSPKLRLIGLGGATEAAIWSIFHEIRKIQPDWRSIPYGRPLPNQTVSVLDADRRPCPDWVRGEIYIGGTGVGRGYWGDAKRTRERFTRHPATGEVAYRTGDFGRYLPNGEIEFLGRNDTQIKLNGQRIELGEIEHALESHPLLDRAVAVAIGSERTTERVVAYVTADGGAVDSADPSGVIRHLAAPPGIPAMWHDIVEASRASARSAVDLPICEQELGERIAHLTEQYRNSICHLFRELGSCREIGERYQLHEIMARHGIAGRYEHWMKRALATLDSMGVMRRQGDVVECLSSVPAFSAGAPAETWLARVLREEEHSAERYLSHSTVELYQHLYRFAHEVARAAFEAFLAARDGERDLAVIEVGAGYGSLTQHLLPIAPQSARYYFTDISTLFLDRAATLFGGHVGLACAMLDLDFDPVIQGFARHHYDVLVAASVLHATRDVRATLSHLRTLLAPGGMLLIVEETRFLPFFDLGMGLQQGFDSFTDTSLRTEHPLLSREAWVAVLEGAGFGAPTVLNRPGSPSDILGFDVIVARAPPVGLDIDSAALSYFLSERLPRYAVPGEYALIDRIPYTANGKVDRAALQAQRRSSWKKRGTVSPRNSLEDQLLAIWRQILGREDFGVTEDFFTIGGDSLLAARLAMAVRDDLRVELPIRTVFDANTVEMLAGVVSLIQTVKAPDSTTSVSGEI